MAERLWSVSAGITAGYTALIWRAKAGTIAVCLQEEWLLVGIIHLSDTIKLNQVREWWYDADNLKVLNLINPENNLKEQVSLKTNWLFHPSIDFYVKTGYADWLILYPYTRRRTQPVQPAITMPWNQVSNLQDNYEVVQKMSWDRWLLKHR